MKNIIIIFFLFGGFAFGQEISKKIEMNFNDFFLPTAELAAKVKVLEGILPLNELEVYYFSLAVKYAVDKNNSQSIEVANKIKKNEMYAQTIRRLIDKIEPSNLLEWQMLTKERVDKTAAINKLNNGYYELADAYGRILLRNKQYEESLQYTELAFKHLKGDSELFRNYYYLLSLNQRYNEALPYLEELVKTGFADEEVKTELTRAYQALNPDKNVTVYLISLNDHLKQDLTTKLAEIEVNIPARDFTVVDVNGKEVSLKDFKGKTVVIDFWSTWCGPCLAALPAMQRVVNSYKSDNSVVFLFINTLEKGNAKAIATDYFKKHHYEMDLYIDSLNPQTNRSPAYEALGAHGLPTKMVIDASGAIRFRTAGYSTGEDQTFEELSLMIEMAKVRN